jgi:hypothetical protein
MYLDFFPLKSMIIFCENILGSSFRKTYFQLILIDFERVN